MGIKKVPTKGWIIIGIIAASMASMMIFQPDWNSMPTFVYWIAGVIGAVIVYEGLKMTGILGKIFGKK